MTRDILFRGFHEDIMGSKTIYLEDRAVAGYWVEGLLATLTTRVSHINVLESDDGNDLRVTTYPVITSTVGQYTGLNDKNGKKIFEGDWCRITSGDISDLGSIEFANGDFHFKEGIRRAGYIDLLSDLEFSGYNLEVIGTIFDKKRTKQTNWIKLPPLVATDTENPSFNTLYDNAPSDVAPMYMRIYMAFGKAVVTKNDNIIYDADKTRIEVEDNYWTTATAEQQARKEPNNDWRISLQAPLSSRTYQRQGENLWVLVEENIGFA